MIEQLITRLVQDAPQLDAQVIEQLTSELRVNGSPLALSIARVVELVADHLIDAGIALPALAMACGTLVDARLTDREREAARNEIETLLPMPDGGKRFSIPAPPDVPLSSLKRRLN